MPDRVLLEEIHLSFTVPARTPDRIRETMRRALNARRFRATLGGKVREALRTTAALTRIRLAIST